MIVFSVYLLTGLLTLLPVLWLMLGAWMGVPVIATEYVSGIGSCILIIASYLTLFQRKTAAEFSIVGILCTLPFWIIESFKSFLHGAFPSILIGLFASFILLMVLSLRFAIMDLRAEGKAPHVTVRKRQLTLTISAIFLVALCGLSFWQQKSNERMPSKYIVPDGYVGWVVIHLGVKDAAPVSVQEGSLVFNFPESGVLQTSSKEQFGSAIDHYYYKMAGGKLQELPNTGWGKGGMIWAESSGTSETPNGPVDQTEQFFVGTESQYDEMQNLPELKGGIQPGNIKSEMK